MPHHRPRALVRLWCLFFGDTEADALPILFEPADLVWRYNGDRVADEVEFEVDAQSLRGLDPRGLYSVRVEVFCADTPPGTILALNRANLRFVGFVDEPEMMYDTGADTLKMTGRDYTSLLIDQQVPQGLVEPGASGGRVKFQPKTYNLKRTFADFVDEVLEDAAGAADLFRDAPIDPDVGQAATAAAGAGAGFTSGLIAAVTRATLRQRKWIDPDVANRRLDAALGVETLEVDSGDSLWDVLNKVCDRLGVVPTFDLDFLWIKRPSDYHAGVYHFATGRNLRTLKLGKSLTAGVSRKVFEILCFNPLAATEAGKVVRGVWPPNRFTDVRAPVRPSGTASNDPSNVARGGSARGSQNQRVKDPVVRFLVDGDWTEAQLTDVARAFYEEAARLDLQGEFTTADMVDLGFEDGFPRFPADTRFNRFVGLLGDPGEAEYTTVIDPASGEELLVSAPSRVRYVAPGREPESVLRLRNSSLVFVDVALRPAPTSTAILPRNLYKDERTAQAVVRSQVAGSTALKALYVLEAEHHWNNKTGYELSVKFTSVIGTDVGGPSVEGRSDVDLL